MFKPGDFFLYYNPEKKFSNIVISIIQFYNLDGKANFSHSGIITNSNGEIFEAARHIEKNNIYEKYINTMTSGCKLMVVRNKKMNNKIFEEGFKKISKYEGHIYPYHRLILFLFYPLPKYFHFIDWGVCSELTAKFYYYCNLLNFWSGVTPANLEDIAINWKDWKIVFEKCK